MTYLTTRGLKLANFFFSLFSLCMSSSQPISFFFSTIFSTLLIYAQPNLYLNLAWTTHFHVFFFFDFFLVLGMTLHILKMITQNLSAKTYDCSTIILILLKAVNTAGYTVMLILSCMGPVYEGAGQGLWNQNRILFQCSS